MRPEPVGWPLRRLYVYRPDARPGESKDVELRFNPPARVLPVGDDWQVVGVYNQCIRRPTLREAVRDFGLEAGLWAWVYPWDDNKRSDPVSSLATQIEMPGRLSSEEADRIAREMYYRGRTVEQTMQEIARRDRALYPNLRHVMPPREQWPQHEPYRTRVQRWRGIDKLYGATVGPWRRMNGAWWSFARYAVVNRERTQVARVYLNGGGFDHELRFHVWPPVDGTESLGAANDHCRVTPDLLEHFNTGKTRLGARGLWAPTPEDVLTVMRWCDDRVFELWPPGDHP